MTSTISLESAPATPTVIATAPAVVATLAPVATARKRGRPRDPEADGRILAAAADLLLQRGYDAMTVDDVASRARVGKATVYRRWAKKEDLAVAAMRELYGSRMPVPDTGSLRSDLLLGIRSALDFANSAAGAAYLRTAVAESSRDPRIAALYRQANQDSEDDVRTMFARAVERGEMRPDVNVDAAAQVISGVLLVRSVTGTPMPSVAETETLVDLLLHGITAQPAA